MVFSVHRILMPLHAPALVERLLPVVASLAKRYGASVLLVGFVDDGEARRQAAEMASQIPGADVAQMAEHEMAAAERRARELVREVTRELRGQRIKVRSVLVRDDPEEAVLALIGQERVDMIAMATRGRTGLARTLGGSLADHLIRESGVPVVTVAEPPDDD